MKSSPVLVAVLLVAGSVIADLTPSYGVLPGSPLNRRSIEELNVGKRAACNSDNVLRALRASNRSVAASAFCSEFLQPTVTATIANTVPSNGSLTTFITTRNLTTITATATIQTNTVLCPSPSPSQICNYPAYGFSTYLISGESGVDAVSCHELCLQDPNCKSFQVKISDIQYCNLYNAVTSGNVQYAPDDEYTFFDRGCPNYAETSCSSLVAQDVLNGTVPIPRYLATVPATRISSACSCLITSPATANNPTLIIPYTIPAGVTTTIPVTITATETVFVSVSATTCATV